MSISQRMQKVRERGHLDAYELKLNVDRLSDWREHVRSHPVAAVMLSATASFMLVRSVTRPPPPPKPKRSTKQLDNQTENEVAVKAGATSAVAAMAGTLLTDVVKNLVTQQLRNSFRGR